MVLVKPRAGSRTETRLFVRALPHQKPLRSQLLGWPPLFEGTAFLPCVQASQTLSLSSQPCCLFDVLRCGFPSLYSGSPGFLEIILLGSGEVSSVYLLRFPVSYSLRSETWATRMLGHLTLLTRVFIPLSYKFAIISSDIAVSPDLSCTSLAWLWAVCCQDFMKSFLSFYICFLR